LRGDYALAAYKSFIKDGYVYIKNVKIAAFFIVVVLFFLLIAYLAIQISPFF
jgi:hypothetical protein